MKILVLSHISEYVGGAEKSLLDVFELWNKSHDIQPEFILKIPVGTMGKTLRDRKWKYYQLDYTFWSEATPPDTKEATAKAAEKNTRAVVDIERIIKKTKPDVVVTNSVVSPWAAIAAYKQKIPHVWFVREYGDLDHGRIYEIGRKKTLEDVGNLSELVIANSDALKKHLEKYIDKNKLTVIYNPFDIDKLNNLAKEKTKNPFKDANSLKLVATGSLTPSKGQLDIVKAAAALNKKGIDTELCLIGSNGPKEYEDEIRKVTKDNGLRDKVHLVGHQKNPLAYVAKADVGVMASRMEAFGRVTFEYMAIGKPVVGTNSGGTPEMITSGENGFLYKNGNVQELAGKLEKYANDRNLLKKHGTNSAKKAKVMMEGEYNAKKAFKKVQAVLGNKKSDKKINYIKNMPDYERIANESRIIVTGKNAGRRIKAKAGRGYRLSRRIARKVIKERKYAKN
jgi:glycosyltransferase involved in cell wall biosynthesis